MQSIDHKTSQQDNNKTGISLMNDDLKILLKDNHENQMDSPISNDEGSSHIVRPVNDIHEGSRKLPREDFETA